MARVGVDVGGTNTDAVLLEGTRVLGWAKVPTSADVTTGITDALRHLFERTSARGQDLDAVMIGTTHFTNAVVERRSLARVAVVRIGSPATESLPPMVDWPPDLRAAVSSHVRLVGGGNEFDGREIARLDEHAVHDFALEVAKLGVHSVAVTAVFSPVDPEVEKRVASLVQEVAPRVSLSLSHEIGRIGLLERENATILNAALQSIAGSIFESLSSALLEVGIRAPLFISQNDGTLMTASYARKYPVLSIASGPTNSMRGAALLSGVTDAIVVDIGGTTTDVGVLSGGFPRESSSPVIIGGVRTNFRMPDVLSIGLGGGSLVRERPSLAVGPESVGSDLITRAMTFGGTTLTATDIVVAAGHAAVGDPSRVANLERRLVADAVDLIHREIARAVDSVRASAEPLPVVLVGGGSLLVSRRIEGAAEVIVPKNYAVANAIGAGAGQVGGEAERVVSLDTTSRLDAIADATHAAKARAAEAGADPTSIVVVDVDEVPIAYVAGNAVRLRVKVVGDLLIA